MGKKLTPTQIGALKSTTAKTRLLITINLAIPIRILENDSTGSLSITRKNADGTFIYDANGNHIIDTYHTKLVKTSEVQGSLDGNSEKIDIIISDISQDFAGLITDDGDALTNKKCRVEQVIFNGDTSEIIGVPILLFEGLINNIQLSPIYCAFSVERQLYSYSTVSPNMTYDINCQFKLGDTRCGYKGNETKCDKTLARCQALGKVTNFGGYPSVIIPVSTS